jgi:hypothetical protein
MEQSTGDDVAGNGRSVLTLTPISGFFLSTMIFGGAVTVDRGQHLVDRDGPRLDTTSLTPT